VLQLIQLHGSCVLLQFVSSGTTATKMRHHARYLSGRKVHLELSADNRFECSDMRWIKALPWSRLQQAA